MFRKRGPINPTQGKPEKGLSPEQFENLQAELSQFIKGQAAESKLPQTALLPLKALVECSDQMFSLGAAAKSDAQRRSVVLQALLKPYLDLCLDDYKKRLIGDNRGKRLIFLEALIAKYLAASAEQKTGYAPYLNVLVTTKESRAFTVNQLFLRLMVDGFGKNKPKMGKKALRLVSQCYPSILLEWNQKVSAALPPSEGELFKLHASSGGEVPLPDLEKLTKDKESREKISKAAALEFLMSQVTKEAYKLRVLLLDDKLDLSRRAKLVVASNQLESLCASFNALSSKDPANFKDEMYKALFKAYVNAYIFDRSKAFYTTAKGEFLTLMDKILKKFQRKTGSTLFSGADKATVEAGIFSSLDTKDQNPETRVELVDYVFVKALQGGFEKSVNDSPEQAQKKRMTFVNAIKAVVRMGEAAVDEWNSMAARMNQGSKNDYPDQLPFPDLVISAINESEVEANRTYEALANNESFLDFIQSWEFMAQRERKEQVSQALASIKAKPI